MPKYTLDDFSGGLTEFPEDANINKMVSTNNVTLTNSRKLRTRGGIGFLVPGEPAAPTVISRATNSSSVSRLTAFDTGNGLVRTMLYGAGNAQMYDQAILIRNFTHNVPNRGSFVAPDYHIFSTRRTLVGPVYSGSSQLLTTANNSLSDVVQTERGFYWGRQSESYLLRLVSQFPTFAINAEMPKLNGFPVFPASASGFTYIYYFHYYFQYTNNGKTFIDLGPPYFVAHSTAVAVSGAAPLNISNIFPMKAYNQCYPSSNSSMTCGVAIYRTRNQGTTGYLLGTVTDNTFTFLDNKSDAQIPITTSLLLPAIVYTDGNALDNESSLTHFSLQTGDSSSPFKITFANNCLWAINANNTRQLMQSKPLEYGVFPGSFVNEVQENMTDLSSVDVYPVFFTNNKSYRVEGTVDGRGIGISRIRVISETVGAIRNTAVQVNKAVYFVSREQGFFSTDGFETTLIDEANPLMYQKMYTSSAVVSATYNNDKKKIYWGFASGAQTYITDIIEMDVSIPNKPLLTFFQISGSDQLRITSLASRDGFLYLGDAGGYLLKFSDNYSDDYTVNTSAAESTWSKKAIIESFTTVPISLGERFTTKWFTKVYLFCRQFGALFPDLTLKITSIAEVDGTDNKELRTVRERDNANRIHSVKRWFRRGKIRSRYRQLRIEKPEVILYASLDYAQITTNPGVPNAVLAAGTWPANIVGNTIRLAVDGYTASYLIASSSGNTVILSTAPPSFTGEWEMYGFPKNERIQFEGIELEYAGTGETIKNFTPESEGANP